MFQTTALLLLAVAVVLWLLSLPSRNASIADSFWGVGFILVCMAGLRWFAPVTQHKVLVSSLVFLWGARLSIYILWRNWGQGEDYRYRVMRDKHGASFAWKSLFTVFLLQAFIAWIIALPLQVTLDADEMVEIGPFAIAGIAVFVLGLFIETLADWQLARFKAEGANKGQVYDQGLWRYSRHPNYFGEALVWWGLYLAALPAPLAPYTIASPLLMTALLLKVSGVPLVEKHMRNARPGYAGYVRKTPAFFPWRPRV